MQAHPLPVSAPLKLKAKLDKLETKFKDTPRPGTLSFNNLRPNAQNKARSRWAQFRLIEREYLKAYHKHNKARSRWAQFCLRLIERERVKAYHEDIKAKVFDQLLLNIACFLGPQDSNRLGNVTRIKTSVTLPSTRPEAPFDGETDPNVVNLKGASWLTDGDILQLTRKYPNLQTLDLSGCHKITDSGCHKITDAGLEHLKVLTSLRSLKLERCSQITDEGLKRLKKLNSLQTLNLNWCWKITDAGLYHLQELNTLQTLNLSYCIQITDEGLKHLKVLTNLRSLNLCGCQQITDEGLKHLKVLTNLRSLVLESCQITDAGLKVLLEELINLQLLDLAGCYEITDQAFEYFRSKGIEVYY